MKSFHQQIPWTISRSFLPVLAVLTLALIPIALAEDPFGSLTVQYQDRLEPGSENARLDLALYLPSGYQVFDVALTLIPEDPIQVVHNRTIIGRMGQGTAAIATFYLDVNSSAEQGVYEATVAISYRKLETGSSLIVNRTIQLVVEEKLVDPFGPISISTSPSVLVPGLEGVEVSLALPYVGVADRLYDVSVSLDLVHPFSSANASFDLGLVTRGSMGVAVFYLDVADGAVSGEYDIPVTIRYRMTTDGEVALFSRVAKLLVVSEEADPFGPLGVVTSPSILVPGLEGVEIGLALPYPGGLVDRLFDVSVTLYLLPPFSSTDDSLYLGVMTPQSPIGPPPTAVFYLDIDESAEPGIHRIQAIISYRTSDGGPTLAVARTIQLLVREEAIDAIDPFGSMGVATVPTILVPGLRGVNVRLTLPYIGFPDRLYDVSLSLGLDPPFSSVNDTYYLGMMSPQSPIAPVPLAVFYLDVAEDALSNEYDIPVTIRYRVAQDGEFRFSQKSAKLFVVNEEMDPFGSPGVATTPSVLLPGLRGVEMSLTLPYHGGLVDRLHDVSVSLGLNAPFSSVNDTFHFGIISPQSPVGPPPTAIFYLDVAEGSPSSEYDIPVRVRYRLTQDGEFRFSQKLVKLFVASEEADPFGPLGVVTTPPVLVPGLRGVELRLRLPYLGGQVDQLHDVSLTLGLTNPFSAADSYFYMGMMSPQSPIGPTPEAVYYLDVAEGAPDGEYGIPVAISYRTTQEGKPREIGRSVKLAIADPEPIWVVRSLGDGLKPGSSDIASILLENKGGATRDVTAKFIPEGTALVKPEEGTIYAGDFNAGESKKVSFPVLVEKGASGSQLVTIEIEYSTDGSRIAESHSVTLRVGGLLGASLILGDVTLVPEPRIGMEFEAILTIENVGSEEAQAALLDLTLPGSLGVVGSGSSISIGTVPAGQTEEVGVQLVVDSSALEGTEEVQYLLKWANVVGEEFGRGGSFGVTLTGEPRVVIQRIDVDPPKLESRAKGTFQVTLRNPGSQLVSDIVVQLLSHNIRPFQ